MPLKRESRQSPASSVWMPTAGTLSSPAAAQWNSTHTKKDCKVLLMQNARNPRFPAALTSSLSVTLPPMTSLLCCSELHQFCHLLWQLSYCVRSVRVSELVCSAQNWRSYCCCSAGDRWGISALHLHHHRKERCSRRKAALLTWFRSQ